MQFGFRERLVTCVLVALTSMLLTHSDPMGERVFWTVIAVFGVTAFLLVKPSVPLKKRLQMIGLWELMAPLVLIVFASISNPEEIERNALRLVFIILFFVGVGTAARLLFWRGP